MALPSPASGFFPPKTCHLPDGPDQWLCDYVGSMASQRVFSRRYRAALLDYLLGSGESGLTRAYDLGRSAINEGLGLLQIIQVHQRALYRILESTHSLDETLRRLKASEGFITETLSPFEMTYRGYLALLEKHRYLGESIPGASAFRRVLAASETATRVQERKPTHGIDRAPRCMIHLPVRYHEAGATDWHTGVTENLSESGVLFRTSDPRTSNGRLVIVFEIGEIPVGCRGEVVRTVNLGAESVVAARFSDS